MVSCLPSRPASTLGTLKSAGRPRGLRRCLAGLAAWALLSPVAAAAQGQTDAPPAEVELPFLTQRNAVDAEDPKDLYGGARSTLKAGHCRVRARDLSVLAPLADAAPNFLREDLLRISRATRNRPGPVLDRFERRLEGRAPTLYMHGYHIDFDKGCRRAVLLQQNAGISGRMLWFTWPSDGALASYMQDAADLYWSVPDMAETILGLVDRFGQGRVNVMGHSLGGRGVALALYEVANRRPDARLDQVVLLAPDMDFAIFARLLPRIAPLAERITIYVNDGDRPLALSQQVHGYARLGQAGNPVEVLDGVEIIDVSRRATSTATGHLYHLYDPAVGADINRILTGGAPAADRPGLAPLGANLWALEPTQDDAAD
jgi:esterase/lipase superfamily enzyme